MDITAFLMLLSFVIGLLIGSEREFNPPKNNPILPTVVDTSEPIPEPVLFRPIHRPSPEDLEERSKPKIIKDTEDAMREVLSSLPKL